MQKRLTKSWVRKKLPSTYLDICFFKKLFWITVLYICGFCLHRRENTSSHVVALVIFEEQLAPLLDDFLSGHDLHIIFVGHQRKPIATVTLFRFTFGQLHPVHRIRLGFACKDKRLRTVQVYMYIGFEKWKTIGKWVKFKRSSMKYARIFGSLQIHWKQNISWQ